MAENKKQQELTVDAALAQIKALCVKADELNTAANDTLKGITGAIIGACFAFKGNALRLNNFVTKSLMLIKKSAVRKYAPRIEDYVSHECGLKKSEEGYILEDKKALQAAADSVKTASLITYKSDEKTKEEKNKKAEKAAEKQSMLDASAKERVLLMLKSQLADAEKRQEKELSKPQKAYNQSEVDKVKEECKLLKACIDFAEKQ